MQIVISTAGSDLDATVSPIFGRSPGFLLVDSDTWDYRAIDNPAVGAPGGAGIQAAQFIVNQKVDALISGNVGPNAFGVFRAEGVVVYAHAEGTVRQAVEAVVAGQLAPVAGATGPSHAGQARGGGRGRHR